MLTKTYSLRPHCVSCWTTYILQDDTQFLQCQEMWTVSFEQKVIIWTCNNTGSGYGHH